MIDATLFLRGFFEILESAAGEPILVFNHVALNREISKQGQLPRTAIVDPGGNLFDHHDDIVTPDCAVVAQVFGLSFQVLFVLMGTNARIDGGVFLPG